MKILPAIGRLFQDLVNNIKLFLNKTNRQPQVVVEEKKTRSRKKVVKTTRRKKN